MGHVALERDRIVIFTVKRETSLHLETFKVRANPLHIIYELDAHSAIGAEISRHRHELMHDPLFFEDLLHPEHVVNGIEKDEYCLIFRQFL